MIPRIGTTATSFRVFRGYRRQGDDLTEERFLGDLGNVFMPGTPLILRDFGLAAYLPAVLPPKPSCPGLPDEVAIVAYASLDRYQHVRSDTIIGQMYTHSHRAVFAIPESTSLWPVGYEDLDPEPGAVSAFFVDGRPWDWQADGTVVFWSGVTRDVEHEMQQPFVEEFASLRTSLRDAGIVECVGQVGPTWCALWALASSFDDAVLAAVQAHCGSLTTVDHLTSSVAERRLWLDDQPPTAPVTRGQSYSFIFTREARHFLD